MENTSPWDICILPCLFCSLPTHGTSKPCKGPSLVEKERKQGLKIPFKVVASPLPSVTSCFPCPPFPSSPCQCFAFLKLLSPVSSCTRGTNLLSGEGGGGKGGGREELKKKGKKEKKVIYCEALAENHFLNHCTILIRRPYCIQSREDLRGEQGGRSLWSSPEDCKSRLCSGRQDVSGFSACPNLICTRITWPLLMYTVTRNDYFAISKSKALALAMAASNRGGAPGGENKARRLC